MNLPSKKQLMETLRAAAEAHHEFQTNSLNGIHHEQWAIWYSAYILGRLDDFTTPTLLTQWLEKVIDKQDWFKKTAEYVFNNLKTTES